MIDDGTTYEKVRNTIDEKVYKVLKKGRDANPSENYLVVFLFACHGKLKEGYQHIVINEYDRKTKYYKLFPAEEKLR